MIRCSCHGLHGWVPVAASRAPRSEASRNNRARASRWRSMASPKPLPRPERISISDSISSPATDSASTSSAAAASLSSPKRCASERSPESRMANSSSSPTVKSSEASKTSLAVAMSSTTPVSGQIEVQRVEEVDGRARGVDRDLRRHLEQRLGVVEDDPHAGVDQVIGHLLGGLGWDGQHPDDDLLVDHHPLELVVGTDLERVAHR